MIRKYFKNQFIWSLKKFYFSVIEIFFIGYSHHSSSYFQSNNRKVPITQSSLNHLPTTAYSTLNSYHSVIRLPSLPQMSPNNSNNSGIHFFNQKKDCEKLLNSSGNSNVKRKRSWSRAVFSNLQRKGLERFNWWISNYLIVPNNLIFKAIWISKVHNKTWSKKACSSSRIKGCSR